MSSWGVLADEDHTYHMSEEEYFYYKNNWWISLNKSGNDTQPLRKRSDKKTSIVYIKAFTPRSWSRPTRAHSLLEVLTMETSIELFHYLVAMARFLVVFLRIHRKSRKKRQAKACDRSGQPVIYRTWAETSEEWLSRIHPILLQVDRLQLTAVYCNRREVKRQHFKGPVFAKTCKNLVFSLS